MSIKTKIKDFDKAYIRNVITRYVNHRNYLYENFNAFKTTKHLQCITKIKNHLGHYEKADVRAHYHLVRCIESELLFLLPGHTSKYHETWKTKIESLITFCKSKINGEQPY